MKSLRRGPPIASFSELLSDTATLILSSARVNRLLSDTADTLGLILSSRAGPRSAPRRGGAGSSYPLRLTPALRRLVYGDEWALFSKRQQRPTT